MAECRAMSNTGRFDVLRAKYRSLSDAHQLIASNNARLVQAGEQPTDEQLVHEQRVAEAVELVRQELLAAISSPRD